MPHSTTFAPTRGSTRSCKRWACHTETHSSGRHSRGVCTLQSSDATVFDRSDGSEGSDWPGGRAAVEIVGGFEAVQGADDGASHRDGAEDVSVAGEAAAG